MIKRFTKLALMVWLATASVALKSDFPVETLAASEDISLPSDLKLPEVESAEHMALRSLVLSNFLKTWSQQIEQVQARFQYLEQAMLQDTLRPGNKQEVIAWVRKARETVRQLLKENHTPLTESTVQKLLEDNKKIIGAQERALESYFQELQPITPEALATRGIPEELSVEQIQELATSTGQQLVHVNELINSIGLTWYNKLFRGIDTLNRDYSLATWALILPPLISGMRVLPDWEWKKALSYKIYGENQPEFQLSFYPMLSLGFSDNTPAKLSNTLVPYMRSDVQGLLQQNPDYNSLVERHNRKLDAFASNLNKALDIAPSRESTRRELEDLLENIEDALKLDPSLSDDPTDYRNLIKLTLQEHVKEAQNILHKPGNNNPFSWFGRLELFYGKLLFAFTIYQAGKSFMPDLAKSGIDSNIEWFHQKFKELWDHLKGTGFTDYKDLYEIVDDITLDDPRLIGMDHQKAVLMTMALFLLDPEIFIRAGTEIEKGTLLIGPSRSGKTFIAKALAGTVNALFALHNKKDTFGFREVKYWELWIPGSLRRIIDEAKQNAPCIIFIDEIHNLKLQTTGSTELLTEFLTTMNDLYISNDPKSQVFIVAATNRPDLLDPALLQHKRFGNVIRFNLPHFEERKKFFEISCYQSAIDLQDVNIDLLARKTSGCSYGDLAMVINQARLLTNNMESIKQYHLEQALDESIRHLSITVNLTPMEKMTVALYLSGQALAYGILKPYETLDCVTLRGLSNKITEINEWQEKKDNELKHHQHKFEYGHLFTYNEHESVGVVDIEEIKKKIQILCAGYISQEILLGSHSYTYRKDTMQKALDLAKTIVFNGLRESELSKKTAADFNDAALSLVDKYMQEIHTILVAHKDALVSIALLLVKNLTLQADEIDAIIAANPPTEVTASEDPTLEQDPSAQLEVQPVAVAAA
jgi:SpoVK/Ycf46/Vps4 family AAA+-type ATPase